MIFRMLCCLPTVCYFRPFYVCFIYMCLLTSVLPSFSVMIPSFHHPTLSFINVLSSQTTSYYITSHHSSSFHQSSVLFCSGLLYSLHYYSILYSCLHFSSLISSFQGGLPVPLLSIHAADDPIIHVDTLPCRTGIVEAVDNLVLLNHLAFFFKLIDSIRHWRCRVLCVH